MKILSVYNDLEEVKDFLLSTGFINRSDYDDEEFDPMMLFEGDPDFMEIKSGCEYEVIYFICFHQDYEIDGERVVICTSEWEDETRELERFLNREGFEEYTTEEYEFDMTSRAKVLYRGGQGYTYNAFHTTD